MEINNPCITCGACCASFRVSFYWGECSNGFGRVPAELTEEVTQFRRAMIGTTGKNLKCVALTGEIGNCVSCSIYEVRSSVCREFAFSWQDGVQNERCDSSRVAHGLSPLKPSGGRKAA